MKDPARPSPDALLRTAQREARGALKIFLGAAPGVGKTYEMLSEGAARARAGMDVVLAIVETHGRAETEALVAPLETIPRRSIHYRGQALTEMDIDAVLERRPQLALVDELAHSNVDGSRHPKRWQDIVELLDAGINVYTTLNIQHVESLNDVVASFTHVRVRETVPDSVLEDAEIEVVDIPPDELIERLRDGKVYIPAEATRALGHFFSKANLSALREMALRRAAQTVDRQMLEHLDASATPGTFAAGERVLVALNELPGGEALVRTTKRLADALHAPWTAVFIETPRAETFDDAAKARLAATLRLAAGLGATIVTVPAESVIAGLRAQVAAMRATQLVIGKTRRSWWFELRHGSVVTTMLREAGGLAVHVIPATGEVAASRPQRVRGDDEGPIVYLYVAGLVALTTALARLVLPLVGVGAIDLIYLLPVIVAARRYGLRPGLAAGVMAALAFNFFFLSPIYTFTIGEPQSVLTFIVLLGIAAFISRLTGDMRSRATIGVRGARENAALAAFAQALTRVSDAHHTAETICEEVAGLLDVNTVLLAESDGQLSVIATSAGAAPLTPVDRAAADWSLKRGEEAGYGTATLNGSDWQFHPLKTSLGVLAVLGIARSDGGEPVPSDRAVLLSTLVGQASLAQERLRLEGETRQLSVLEERDRLRVALLSSIGHDLRTPLTAVRAAIERIAADHPGSPATPVARAEVDRLQRFLDNLLSMLRLDSGALTPASEAIDLTDAVGAARQDLGDLLRDKRIALDVPVDLPLVRADPLLLHHVLINLLANSVQHAGNAGIVTIEGRREAGKVTLTVRDDGPGLEVGSEARIFDMFASGTGTDRSGGSGLGLAIVKGFAAAMGVGVTARTHAEGGAAFTLSFGDLVEVDGG